MCKEYYLVGTQTDYKTKLLAEIKTADHKPDSVIIENDNGYHLSGSIITDTVYLPTLDHRTSSSKRSYMWHFSMQGLPYFPVARKIRGLLPHIFTLANSAQMH